MRSSDAPYTTTSPAALASAISALVISNGYSRPVSFAASCSLFILFPPCHDYTTGYILPGSLHGRTSSGETNHPFARHAHFLERYFGNLPPPERFAQFFQGSFDCPAYSVNLQHKAAAKIILFSLLESPAHDVVDLVAHCSASTYLAMRS